MNENKGAERKNRDLILVVSFGTTAAESRRLNIEAVEKTIYDAVRSAEEAPYIVRRCFTSQMIISKIKSREGISIDNIDEALDRAERDGISRLVVQPTHLMAGREYAKLRSKLSEHSEAFREIALGDPLLSSEEDLAGVADALIEASAGYEDGETAFVFMGHGTDAESNSVYKRMQTVFAGKDRHDYFIGTVEAEPSLDDVIEAVRKGSYKRVVLRPMMLVAGDHAINDMASAEDPDSWYSRFTAAGYETLCIIEGLGQLPAVRKIYADHVKKAIAEQWSAAPYSDFQ